MSATTIKTLYTAFARLDGEAMQKCYAKDASFEDEVFTLQGREQVGGMWRMLCDATKDKGRDVWRLESSKITQNSAHWEAHYRFSALWLVLKPKTTIGASLERLARPNQRSNPLEHIFETLALPPGVGG